MTEEDAKLWIRERFSVSRETLLGRYVDLLVAEAERQNLISASTISSVWDRHILDSAQLLDHAPDNGLWIDIGSGAGLPGIVIACLTDREVVLVEPRGRRVEFLESVIADIGLNRTTVYHGKIETFTPQIPVAVISARAVASMPDLFAGARHCTNSSTVWVLPKGRNAQSEVEAACATWQGEFHVERSITSPDAGIVIARKVRPR